MNTIRMKAWLHGATIALLCFGTASAADVKVNLSGAGEVPPVTTTATGTGTIRVNEDKSVAGSVTTKGIEAIAAHIHVGAAGKNGPPVITLEQSSPGVWSVPKGSKLTDEQYANFKAGELYVNVHSAAHKAGEIRGQLKP
jgi:CHRD domain